jgi:uncharacterized delta-60 repeat protein
LSLLSVFCLAAWMTASAMAAPADLDQSFGNGGKVTTNSASQTEEGRAVVVQPDGKIIVAGHINIEGTYDFMVARYNSNGTPDTSFGTSGIVSTPVLNGDDYAFAVALQPDGKIVVAGFAFVSSSNADFAVVRYNPDGSLDQTFDTDGKVTTPVLNGFDDAFAVAVQPDGKIVVAGSAVVTDARIDFALVRYNANGSLDTTFDGDGKLTTPFGSGFNEAYAVAIQADGKIVAAGYQTEQGNLDYALARYNPNGSLDTSFDGDGKLTTNFLGSTDMAYAIAIQPDGKLVVAGQTFSTQGILSFAVARYLTNGALDTTFDADGKTVTPILGSNDGASAVALQPNGKIVVAGNAGTGTEFDFAVARYNANGSLDTSFDTDGKLTTKFNDDFDSANGVAIQPDGRIIAAGYATNNSVRNLALARYVGDARTNRTANFDGDGKTDIAVWNPANGFWHVQKSSNGQTQAVQFGAQGDLPVAGDYNGDGQTEFAVFRPSNGTWYTSPDPAINYGAVQFGQNGDVPVQGDYDGDGKTDIAVYRPSTGAWYIRRSSDGSLMARGWGASGDLPVPSDYDGDGATDIAVWRASNGYWYIITSRDNFVRLNSWGKNGDKAAPADYDADGRVDVAVYRPSEGGWYIRLWTGEIVKKIWGNATDVPVAADYDGDGRADVTVYRASELSWYINQSSTNTARWASLGQPGVPVATSGQ